MISFLLAFLATAFHWDKNKYDTLECSLVKCYNGIFCALVESYNRLLKIPHRALLCQHQSVVVVYNYILRKSKLIRRTITLQNFIYVVIRKILN